VKDAQGVLGDLGLILVAQRHQGITGRSITSRNHLLYGGQVGDQERELRAVTMRGTSIAGVCSRARCRRADTEGVRNFVCGA
jgi:hypothetical protein